MAESASVPSQIKKDTYPVENEMRNVDVREYDDNIDTLLDRYSSSTDQRMKGSEKLVCYSLLLPSNNCLQIVYMKAHLSTN